jgi:hypothetical protein
MRRLLLPITLLGAALAGCGSDDALATASSLEPNYTHHIAPLLARACVSCHTRDGLRAGGVELDAYETARVTAVKNACVSVTPALIEAFAPVLKPVERSSEPERPTCADWAPFTMPPDALDKLTPHEQVLLLRWIETGMPQ